MNTHTVRLNCVEFFVDMRLMEHEDRWIAIADTPRLAQPRVGPSYISAATTALLPFDGRIEQLLNSPDMAAGLAEFGND